MHSVGGIQQSKAGRQDADPRDEVGLTNARTTQTILCLMRGCMICCALDCVLSFALSDHGQEAEVLVLVHDHANRII